MEKLAKEQHITGYLDYTQLKGIDLPYDDSSIYSTIDQLVDINPINKLCHTFAQTTG